MLYLLSLQLLILGIVAISDRNPYNTPMTKGIWVVNIFVAAMMNFKHFQTVSAYTLIAAWISIFAVYPYDKKHKTIMNAVIYITIFVTTQQIFYVTWNAWKYQ